MKESEQSQSFATLIYMALNNQAMLTSMAEMQLEMMAKVTGRKIEDLEKELHSRMDENFEMLRNNLEGDD